jgi:transposase-like protein
MSQSQPALFRGRHFRDEIIVLCVRWYLRYPLSYRDLEEMMAERRLTVDHSTIARWVLHYGPSPAGPNPARNSPTRQLVAGG